MPLVTLKQIENCNRAMKQIKTVCIFESSSDPRKTYQTLVYDDGSISCECPGWCRRVQPDGSRTCRHTRDVEAGIAQFSARSVKPYEGRRAAIPAPVQPVLATKGGRAFDLDL